MFSINTPTSSGSLICCPADIFSSTKLTLTDHGHIIIKGCGTELIVVEAIILVCSAVIKNLVGRGKVRTDSTTFNERRIAATLKDFANASKKTFLPAAWPCSYVVCKTCLAVGRPYGVKHLYLHGHFDMLARFHYRDGPLYFLQL